MPLNINPLQLGPLASLAGQTTPNLGLEPYNIDYKALWAKQNQEEEIRAQYAGQLMAYRIADMQEKGYISRDQARQAYESAQKEMDRARQSYEFGVTSDLQRQQNDTLGAYQKGQMDISKQQLAQNFLQDRATNQYKIQELNQTKDFQSGSLDLQRQGLGIEEKKMENDKLMEQIKLAVGMKKEERGLMGSVGSALQAISKLKTENPSLYENAKKGIFRNASEMGYPKDRLAAMMKMPDDELQASAIADTMYGYMGDQAHDKAQSKGLTLNPKTGIFEPEKTPSKLDEKLDEENAKIFGKADESAQTAKLAIEDLNSIEESLNKIPKMLMGPVGGLVGKFTEDGQSLEGKLTRSIFALKNAYNLGSQGFSDADAQLLKNVSGGLTKYKGSVKELVSDLKRINEHAITSQWIRQYKIVKQADPEKFESWKSLNPEPVVKFKNPAGKVYSMKSSDWITKEREIKEQGGVLI